MHGPAWVWRHFLVSHSTTGPLSHRGTCWQERLTPHCVCPGRRGKHRLCWENSSFCFMEHYRTIICYTDARRPHQPMDTNEMTLIFMSKLSKGNQFTISLANKLFMNAFLYIWQNWMFQLKNLCLFHRFKKIFNFNSCFNLFDYYLVS